MFGTVVTVRDQAFWYLACVECFRKISFANCCTLCGGTAAYRYRLNLTVETSQGVIEVTIFGKSLEKWFGIPADDFVALWDEMESSLDKATLLQESVENVFLGHVLGFVISSGSESKSFVASSVKFVDMEPVASVKDCVVSTTESLDNKKQARSQTKQEKRSPSQPYEFTWGRIAGSCNKSPENGGSPCSKVWRPSSGGYFAIMTDNNLSTQNKSERVSNISQTKGCMSPRFTGVTLSDAAENVMRPDSQSQGQVKDRRSVDAFIDDSYFTNSFPIIPPTCVDISDISGLPLDDVTLPVPLGGYSENNFDEKPGQSFLWEKDGRNQQETIFTAAEQELNHLLTESVLEDLDKTFDDENISRNCIALPTLTETPCSSYLGGKFLSPVGVRTPLSRRILSPLSSPNFPVTNDPHLQKRRQKFARGVKENYPAPKMANSTPKVHRTAPRFAPNDSHENDRETDDLIMSSLQSKSNEKIGSNHSALSSDCFSLFNYCGQMLYSAGKDDSISLTNANDSFGFGDCIIAPSPP